MVTVGLFIRIEAKPDRAPEVEAMLKSAFDFISREPWMILPPSLAIALTVLSLNLIGDGMRDALGRVR